MLRKVVFAAHLCNEFAGGVVRLFACFDGRLEAEAIDPVEVADSDGGEVELDRKQFFFYLFKRFKNLTVPRHAHGRLLPQPQRSVDLVAHVVAYD